MTLKINIITILLLLIAINIFSQNINSEQLYFLQFKSYESELDERVPFVDFCIMKNDSVLYQSISDFDGYVGLYINIKENNIDSIYLKIKYPIGHTFDEFSTPIRIPLSKIELFKKIDIENTFQIILTEYRALSKKEIIKYRIKYELMPARQDTKAIDVH